MVFVHCAMVIFLGVLVNLGIPLSVPVQDKADLDEYAKEANRLFDDIAMMNNNTSEAPLYKPNDSKSPSVPSYSDDTRSPPVGTIPEEISKVSGSYEVPEVSRIVPPFSVDKGINPSSTGNQSQQCVLDQHDIASMFKECIYSQAELTTTRTTQTGGVTVASSRDFDARFLKYCRRAPQLRSCVKNLITTKMEHCLDEGVRDSIDNVEKITERIIKFICIHEADRISIFISDGGLECLLASNWRIHLCLSLHLGSYVLLSLVELPSLNVDHIKCVNLESAQRCVARELESCEDPTSAVVARLLFHIAMEVASCEVVPEASAMTTASDTSELTRLPSLGDGEQTTARIIRDLDPLISAGLEHVEITSSGTSNQSHTDQQSTQSSLLNRSSVPSDRDQLSMSSPQLDTTPLPPNYLVNATMSSNDNSAATTIVLMCVFIVFSAIILISYKHIVKNK